MFIFISRHKSTIILIFICAVSLLLSWLATEKQASVSYNSSFEHKASAILAPAYFCSSVIGAVSSRFAYVGSLFASIWRRPAEREQFRSLEMEVENLKYQLDAERERNRRLEELFAVYGNLTAAQKSLKLVPAKVIAVEPTEWFRYFEINRGTKDGVYADMAVITSSVVMTDEPHLTGAVVGKVVEAHSRSARVQLITDRLSVVAATIGTMGDLVLMNGQPETENCVIDQIPSTAHEILKMENPVVVDERSSIFPAGMLVGNISSIEKGVHFCRVEVEPAFRFAKLREVMVVVSK